MFLNFPFKTKITMDGNFCNLFKFENYIETVLEPMKLIYQKIF